MLDENPNTNQGRHCIFPSPPRFLAISFFCLRGKGRSFDLLLGLFYLWLVFVAYGKFQKRPFVHNSVCSQFWESLLAILAQCSPFCLWSFNRNSRGNLSLCWLGGGGFYGHQNCEQTFSEQIGVFLKLAWSFLLAAEIRFGFFCLRLPPSGNCVWPF